MVTRSLFSCMSHKLPARSSDLVDVISSSTECRGANGHFSEDVGFSYPPAQGISSIGRLFALILFIEKKTM